jgi:hypothetical protein
MAFASFYLIDRYATDNTVLIYIGIFLIITGLWGNISKFVFLKIPTGDIEYRLINYIIITLGTISLAFGIYTHLTNFFKL